MCRLDSRAHHLWTDFQYFFVDPPCLGQQRWSNTMWRWNIRGFVDHLFFSSLSRFASNETSYRHQSWVDGLKCHCEGDNVPFSISVVKGCWISKTSSILLALVYSFRGRWHFGFYGHSALMPRICFKVKIAQTCWQNQAGVSKVFYQQCAPIMCFKIVLQRTALSGQWKHFHAAFRLQL